MPVGKSIIYKFPSGRKIELFYIKTLAEELGRSTLSIRRWEIAGIIPDPVFRDKTGKRLYSQEQIDTIAQCAFDAKIKQGGSIACTSFTPKVHKRLKKLKIKYLEEMNYGKDIIESITKEDITNDMEEEDSDEE